MQKFLPIVIALVQWGLIQVTHWDALFFIGQGSNGTYYFVKGFSLIFFIFVWANLFRFVQAYRTGNATARRAWRIAIEYGCFLLIFLLLLWPGTWSWDDIIVANRLHIYQLLSWQHVITCTYQMTLLQILPFPGGFIFLQNVIIVAIVSYIVTKIEETFHFYVFKKQTIDIFVKILPFLLPSVILYQFSGFRMGLYVYFELLMLVILLCTWHQKEVWSKRKLSYFTLLAILVCTWRTEAFVYIFLVAICLYHYQKHQLLTKRRAISCMAFALIGIFSVTAIQSYALNHWNKIGTSQNYVLVATLDQSSELVRHADPERDRDALQAIDRVVNVELIQSTEVQGTSLFNFRRYELLRDYSEADYEGYMHATVQLGVRHPLVFVKERCRLFKNTLKKISMVATKGITTYDPNCSEEQDELVTYFLGCNYFANEPLAPTLRDKTISAIGHMHAGNRLRFAVNALPFLALAIAFFICYRAKQRGFLLLGIFLFLRWLIVFLTAPSNLKMYYLSYYLIGYVVLIYGVGYWLEKRRTRA